MERRDFLKSSCSLCLLLGSGLMSGSLASCAGAPVFETQASGNSFSIPLSLFDQAPTQIARVKGFPFNIAVHRESDGNFNALLLRCTHADNGLTYTGSGYSCSLHGSRFDLEGDVLKGPAVRPLSRFTTHVIGSNVAVTLS